MTDWADELAARVRDHGAQVVNDSKTPSGTVHVGSLRGPVLVDVIARALRGNGIETTYLYGIDDMDPMDAQALLTPDAVEDAMGKPLAHIPDQEGDGHASYARHHAQIFIDTFAGLGVLPDRYYWMSEIYPTGALDPYIRTALDRVDLVRDIYRRIANVQHPSTWHPISVICENCGRVGTTIVTEWNGEQVHYECRKDLVTWARGCGREGWVSPFGGRAKLPWNLEWAAQWSLFGVTIEPCGKDLSTADVVPAEQLRFLFVRPRPNQAIEFDPEGTDAIPRLVDEFDRLAAATAGREVKGDLPAGYESVFRYS